MISFISFRVMLTLGFFFLLMAIIGYLRRNTIEDHPALLKVFVYSIPLPWVATELGLMLAEIGREPWVVYGVMKTSDAVSPIVASQVGISLGRIRARLFFSGNGGLLPDMEPCEERAGG